MSRRTDRYTVDPDEPLPAARPLDVLTLDRLATDYLDAVRLNAWTLALDLARTPDPRNVDRLLDRHRDAATANASRYAVEVLAALYPVDDEVPA